MRLVLLQLLNTRRHFGDDEAQGFNIVLKRLDIKPVKGQFNDNMDLQETLKAIMLASDKASGEQLAKAITEVCLAKLTYTGEIADYEIQTTEPLKWLGVKVPNISSADKGENKKEVAKNGKAVKSNK